MANLDLLENSIPVAPLKLAALPGSMEMAKKVDAYLVQFRKELAERRNGVSFSGYSEDSFLIDCELMNMGVSNFITFDAHDPRVMNAIPLGGFDNFMPTYQFLKALLRSVPDLTIDNDHLMIISPDEGAMARAVYFSNVLGVDMGMFYKRRDYSTIVNGKNPIVAHEFLGDSVAGKDVVIIDDMISSGESMLDVAKQVKERGADHVFVCTTFGLFTDGLEKFDAYYEKGYISKVITTDLTYRTPELVSRPWYEPAEMSKYMASIIDTLNHDVSVAKVQSTTEKINKLLAKHR